MNECELTFTKFDTCTSDASVFCVGYFGACDLLCFTVMGGTKCAACKKGIGKYDELIECSNCSAKHHISCAGIDEKQLTDLNASGLLKNWSCVKCPRDNEVPSVRTRSSSNPCLQGTLPAASSVCGRCDALLAHFSAIAAKLETRIIQEMASFKQQITDEIKSALGTSAAAVGEMDAKISESLPSLANKVAELQSSLCTNIGLSSSVSYAQAASSSKCSVIIKPKDETQSNATTKTDLLRGVNPIESNVSVTKVRHIKGGGLLVSCSSKDEANKLSNEVSTKLADKYTVREVKAVSPRIRIVGMTEEHGEESFVGLLTAQNQSTFSGSSDLQLISFGLMERRRNDAGGGSQRKKSRIYQAVVQVNIATYQKALDVGQLLVGYDCCSVYDAVEVTRCYNCCGYNHISNNCKSKRVCPRCTGDHLVKDCTSHALKCINCFNAGGGDPSDSIHHAAWDRSCGVYRQKLKRFKADVLGLK